MPPAFRADQVGSLLRPEKLLDARALHQRAQLDRDGLTRAEDEAILQVLEMQRQVGMDVFTDGEYRRTEFRSVFADAVGGMVEIAPAEQADPPLGGVNPVKLIGDKVERLRRLTAHESGFLNQHAEAPIKITLPSVSQIVSSFYRRGVGETAYPDTAALYPDIIAILRQEIEDLVTEGVSYIQIDAPRYTYFVDERWRQRFRDQGEDPDLIIDKWIDADNASISGIKLQGTTLAMHLCRGNNRGAWFGEGDYSPIAEKIFNGINIDRFLLEFDSDRSGGFEPLRYVPRDKTVVLGLITTKTGPPEEIDELLRRIEQASHYFPMENLSIRPPVRLRHLLRRQLPVVAAATPQAGTGGGDGAAGVGITGCFGDRPSSQSRAWLIELDEPP